MSIRGLLVLGLLVIASNANAKLFRNAYVSFELPPNWNCKLEGSEWVCENDFATKTKEAIIILTAKEVGPTDTLPAYLAHLQTPRALTGRGGQPMKSKIISVKERMISNHMWIDGMHEGSEIGPYFTRYLATIKDRIAILVTFSAHKEHYTKYSNDFIKAVESLRVVATKDTLPGRGDSGGAGAPSGQVGVSPGAVVDYQNELPMEAPPRSGGGSAVTFAGFGLLLAAIAAYFVSKRKKKPSAKPPQAKPKKK